MHVKKRLAVGATAASVAALGGGFAAQAATADYTVPVITSCTTQAAQAIDYLINRNPDLAATALLKAYGLAPDQTITLLSDLAACDPNGAVTVVNAAANLNYAETADLVAKFALKYPDAGVLHRFSIEIDS